MKTDKAPNVAEVNAPGRRTVCSICGMCSTRCPIQVTVDSGKVVWIQGNLNDPLMGSSLCAKGSAGLTMEYDDERPQYPMIRTGDRGSGQWRCATWPEALDYVAVRMKESIDREGGRSIALSDRSGPFTDLTKSFVKALGSPNYFNHDCTCGLNAHQGTRSLFGLGRADFTYDFKNTRHIVLYGRNMIEALQVKEAKEFMQALRNGAKLTYIDPRATLTAAKADRYWQIRPNTEYALNLAFIQVVLEEDLYDREFVGRWVNGMDELRYFCRDKTPEWQETRTGIPAEQVKDFIREIASAAPRVIFHAGWMTARHRQSFYSSRSTHILNALFGAIETPGGVLFAKKADSAGRHGLNKLVDRIPSVTEKRVDGCGWKYPHLDSGSGVMHLLFSAMASGDPYPVGAYIAYRHDPLLALPDPEAIKKALDKVPLVVAIDINYSETAWYSDVILPEATYLERANILGESHGLKPGIQMRDQAIAPRFDSRPAWWIFKELARRLDVGRYFEFETIEDIWSFQLENTGVTIEQLRSCGVMPLVENPIWYDRKNGLKFGTASGKIELANELWTKEGFPMLADFHPPANLSQGEFRLLFGRSAVHNHGHTMNNPLLHELMSENPLWMHPDQAQKLGVNNGDQVEISNQGYSAEIKVLVTPWIHPEAVFLMHGFGRTVPRQTRAFNHGVGDHRLQIGFLSIFDPAGGGNALCECTVRVRKT